MSNLSQEQLWVLKDKLEVLLKEAMIRDKVLPKCPWNPNLKTKIWLKERGFRMGYAIDTTHQDTFKYKMAGEKKFIYLNDSDLEGFFHVEVNHRSTTSRLCDFSVWIPENLGTRALILGYII